MILFRPFGIFYIVGLSKLNCCKIKISYAILENCHEVLHMNLVCFSLPYCMCKIYDVVTWFIFMFQEIFRYSEKVFNKTSDKLIGKLFVGLN